MKILLKTIMAAAAVLVSFPTQAIVIRHDTDDSLYLADSNNYRFVASVVEGRAVATLIDRCFLLTAGHVADYIKPGDVATVAQKKHPIKRVINHPSWHIDKVGQGGVHDAALLELQSCVDDIVPAEIYTRRDEEGKIVTFAGWGRSGDGITGSVSKDKRFRIARNKVDTAAQGLVFSFSDPRTDEALPLEGISGAGDSGGPAFITENEETYILGISSFQDEGVLGKPGLYGVTEHYTRVSQIADWIKSHVHAKAD